MLRRASRLFAPILSTSLVLASCQTPPGSAPPLKAADGSVCPGWEAYDGAAVIALSNEKLAERETWITEYTSITPLPPGAEEAETRIRTRVPPTGMWALDSRVTLWKASSGTWQVATKNIDYRAPPPPPPPPPPVDENGNLLPGFEDWTPPPEIVEPPYFAGPLAPERAAQLDALLADPCFINGPDSLPHSVPVRTRKAQTPPWICPPDSAYYMAEVKQPGLPTRYIDQACYMDFAVSSLLTLTAYSAPMTPTD